VEERVRRVRVDNDLVRPAGCVEVAVELLDELGRDALVGAAEEAEERTAQLGRVVLRRVEPPLRPIEPGVEGDRAREPELFAGRARERRAEAGAVTRLELEQLGGGAARRRRQREIARQLWRDRVELEAHRAAGYARSTR